MNDHNVYAVLCTLAATGQLSTSERADFDEHCLHCAACRDQRQELICIGMQLQLDGAAHATSGPMPIGSLERFCARVVREGIARALRTSEAISFLRDRDGRNYFRCRGTGLRSSWTKAC